jgi:hypothetical protein
MSSSTSNDHIIYIEKNNSSIDISSSDEEGGGDSYELERKLLVFYVDYILDDKNTLCNGCILTGWSVFNQNLHVFKQCSNQRK